MAANTGTKIVDDGLVFHLDALNTRSYPGTGTVVNNLVVEVLDDNSPSVISGQAFEYISQDNASTRGYGGPHDPVDVKGESDIEGGACSGLLTFEQAVQFVHGFNARLPTVDEVLRRAAEGTGCGYDAELIWTADAANPEGTKHYVVMGDVEQNSFVIEARDVTSTAYVRYVADVDTNRSDPVLVISDYMRSILETYYSTTYPTTLQTKQIYPSNNNSNPTLNNGVIYNNGYFEFDGVDDVIDVNRSFCSIDVPNDIVGNVPYTMESWVYPTQNPGDLNAGGSIFGSADSTGIGLQLMYNEGLIKVNFGYRSNFNLYSTSGINLNEWSHVVGVKDPSNTKVNIYINGLLDVSYDTNDLDVTSTELNLQIGAAQSRMGYFTGRISEIKLYDTALTADEVKKNFVATRGRYSV